MNYTLMVAISVLSADQVLAQSGGDATALPPAAAPAPTPICTDRPTHSNFACTVPDGGVQIEADAINWSRRSLDGTTTDIVLFTNPTVKYGLSGSTDVEVNWAPYASVHTHRPVGSSTTVDGTGDVILRFKQRLTAADAKLTFSMVPFVKAPTARAGIGNGQWEGGLIGATNYQLTPTFLLTLDPELDVRADASAPSRRHLAMQQLINLGWSATPRLTLYGEVWTDQDYDPAGTTRQFSADFAIAWLLRPRLQLDAGTNLGLNRATPGTQVYLGVSALF